MARTHRALCYHKAKAMCHPHLSTVNLAPDEHGPSKPIEYHLRSTACGNYMQSNRLAVVWGLETPLVRPWPSSSFRKQLSLLITCPYLLIPRSRHAPHSNMVRGGEWGGGLPLISFYVQLGPSLGWTISPTQPAVHIAGLARTHPIPSASRGEDVRGTSVGFCILATDSQPRTWSAVRTARHDFAQHVSWVYKYVVEPRVFNFPSSCMSQSPT